VLWAAEYYDLSDAAPGLLGAVTSRAEAQVMRLSLLYALLDGKNVIGEDHLTAALALWDYCARSARFIFGDAATETEDERRLIKLLEVIAGRPDRQVSVHWLANSSRKCYRGKRDLAERDLMALAAQGLGELRDPPLGPATGRVFVLNGDPADADATEDTPTAVHPHPTGDGAAFDGASDVERLTDFLGDGTP
jgi:hypothetical protein